MPIPQFTKDAYSEIEHDFREKLKFRFNSWITSKSPNKGKPIGIDLGEERNSAGVDVNSINTDIATLSDEQLHVYLNNGFEC